jgi:hypothetical protein
MAGQYVVQRWNVTVGWGYGRQRARQGEEWARRFQRRLVATVGLGCSCCEGPLVRHHHQVWRGLTNGQSQQKGLRRDATPCIACGGIQPFVVETHSKQDADGMQGFFGRL